MDPQRTELFQIATGYWLSKALFCAARAGVADQLAAGPRPVNEVARAAEVDAGSLYRILRALASVGIFEETEAGVFALTPKAQYLRADHPESVKHFVLMVVDELYDVWCDLYDAVERGGSALEKRFGRDFFARLGQDLQKSQLFDRAMQEIHGDETRLMLEHYDFSRHSTVLDIGGGNGSTLCGILAAHPHLQGRLFDLPQVVANARTLLANNEPMAEPVARIEFLPGDFFQAIPGIADCIVLRHVIHDWNDERALTILRNAASAMDARGSLLIVEKVITSGNEPSFVKLLDLNMLAIGGKERTEPEYRWLLDEAGLVLHRIHTTPGAIDVIEARR